MTTNNKTNNNKPNNNKPNNRVLSFRHTAAIMRLEKAIALIKSRRGKGNKINMTNDNKVVNFTNNEINNLVLSLENLKRSFSTKEIAFYNPHTKASPRAPPK